jgi:hypothetical protein
MPLVLILWLNVVMAGHDLAVLGDLDFAGQGIAWPACARHAAVAAKLLDQRGVA